MTDLGVQARGQVAAVTKLLEVESLTVRYRTRGSRIGAKSWVHAVDDVSFELSRSETLGLVGESGCGKSTTARAIAQLTPILEGRVRLDGVDLTSLSGRALRTARRRIQLVFQDPQSSLDPRMKVASSLLEPLTIHGISKGEEARQQALEMLDAVGLPPRSMDRYPHEFSGGQRQRIAIARALMVAPDVLICDEPVSALDVSVRAQIINLLDDLQERLAVALLFIAHDIAVVRHMATRIAVMYLGQIVEMAGSEELCQNPLHPYTKSLISAVPSANPIVEQGRQRIVLRGDIPNPASPPPGCRFHTRCPHAQELCRTAAPKLDAAGDGRLVACHFWSELAAYPVEARSTGTQTNSVHDHSPGGTRKVSRGATQEEA